ncbi:MAG: YbaK/EbsC family protein [Chloroflexi bacterium]|nr:YbaK/EbsC family protein [Chloroflexota bacterium]
MKPSVKRVADALHAAGIDAEIRQTPASTRTAEEAAAAVGATVPRIVKSLVFLADGEPILALVSGSNRLDTARLGAALGKSIARADAATVRAATGFAIGGVPPLGHTTPLPVIIDRDLTTFDVVWAAAGTPNAVFPVAPAELVRATGGTVLDLKVEADA